MRKRIPIGPIELLRMLMRQRKMTIQDLAHLLKTGENEVVGILTKDHPLSEQQIHTLSKIFQVTPESFSPQQKEAHE